MTRVVFVNLILHLLQDRRYVTYSLISLHQLHHKLHVQCLSIKVCTWCSSVTTFRVCQLKSALAAAPMASIVFVNRILYQVKHRRYV